MKLITSIIIVALLVVAILLFFYTRKKSTRYVVGIISFVILLLLIIIPSGFHTVETGEVGVVKEFGKIKEVKSPGLFWIFFPTQTVEIYDTKNQQIELITSAYSQDAQTMEAVATIQFRIRPDKVSDIASEFGSLETLIHRIRSISEEKLKVVLSSKSAMKLIESRSTLSPDVELSIKENTSRYYVDITMVAVTDITFNDAFELAVENKMIAEQEKLKAEYDKEKAIIKAEEELAVAIKAAEAKIETAMGDAQSMIEIAQAEAETIQLKSIEAARMLGFTINEDGTINMDGKTAEEIKVISEYLKYIEYLSVWDGELPSVVGGGNEYIIPLPNIE